MSTGHNPAYRPRYNDAELWPKVIEGIPEAECWVEQNFRANYTKTNKTQRSVLPNVGKVYLRELLVKILMFTVANDPAIKRKVEK